MYTSIGLIVLLHSLPQLITSMHNYEDACTRNYIDRKIDIKDGISGIITSPHFHDSCQDDVKMEVEFSGEGEEMESGTKFRVQLDIFYMNMNYDQEEGEAGKDGQSASQCDHSDYIKVWVKVDDSKREIASMCGWCKGQKMMSSNHLMWMEFVRRSGSEFEGIAFNASYHFVTDFGIQGGQQHKNHEKECMFEYLSSTSKNGTFTSPNYPGLYPRNTECYYIFKGAKIERIVITFIAFNVEGTHNCEDGSQSDYVEFSNFNIGLIDRKMDRFCGSNLQKNEVQSDGSFFRVTFFSNNAYDSTGFEAHYQFKMIEEQQPPMRVNKVQTHRNAAITKSPLLSSFFALLAYSFLIN